MITPSSSIVDHCTPLQLRALLAIATHSSTASSGAALADNVDARRLTASLTELCRAGNESGEVLIETVCSPQAPLEALRGVKELAKRLVAAATTREHRSAATVLYHAAVAAAFVQHDVNVSTRPIEARAALYEDLAAALAGHPLTHVFFSAAMRALRSADPGGGAQGLQGPGDRPRLS